MLAATCTIPENQNDRTFMLELYQQFFRLMFFTARKYVLQQDACEEVVQESLVRLIPKVSMLRKMPSPVLASYIVSTTRNTAIDYFKQKMALDSNVSSLDDESFSARLESQLPPLDIQLEAEELREELATVLAEI